MSKEVDQIAFRRVTGGWQLVAAFITTKAALGLLFIGFGLCLFTPLLAKGQSPENALLFWSRRDSGNAVYVLDGGRLLAGVCHEPRWQQGAACLRAG